MARYLVENSRPRQLLVLFGRTLASVTSSTKNKPGQMWLTGPQFESEKVQGLLGLGRLTLVKAETDLPTSEPAVEIEEPAVIEEPPALPIPEAPADPITPTEPVVDGPVDPTSATPLVETPVPEPEPVPAEPTPEPVVEAPIVEPAVTEPPLESPMEPTPEPEMLHAEEPQDDLDTMKVPALRELCGELGLDTKGNKPDLVARIRASQGT